MPAAATLRHGEYAGVSLGTGVSHDFEVETSGTMRTLLILARLSGSADGDLSVHCNALLLDGTTLGLQGTAELPPEISAGPTHSGGKVYALKVYNVKAFTRVRIRARNNNAGTQTLEVLEWDLQSD